MKAFVLFVCATLVTALTFSERLAAQTPSPTKSPTPETQGTPVKQEEFNEGDIVRINTTLVTVPVSVMDRKNRYLANLSREQFHVFENGIEQQVAFFASVDKPFTVALLLDISDSTQAELKLIQDAAIAFIDQLRPEDQVVVIAFDSRVRLLVQPTLDREPARTAIRALQSGHGTSLYAVVQESIKEFPNSIFGRKAIVLLTDGIDTTSPRPAFTFETSIERAEQSDVAVYSVQFLNAGNLDPSDPGVQLKFSFPEGKAATAGATQARARDYLHQLAEKTGGQEYVAPDVGTLDQAFARVAESLRRQYSLGYYPQKPAPAGETRQIKIVVDQPNAIVHARTNYVSGVRAANPSAKP